MTELQVKAKKGSLKKFLATFLAVCVCMTTVHMNGTFAQAAGENSDVTPTVALKDGQNATVELKMGANVTADLAERLKVSPDNAQVEYALADGASEYVEMENTSVVKAKKATGEAGVKITAKVSDDTEHGQVQFTIKVAPAESEPGGKPTINFADNVTPGIALKVGDAVIDLNTKVTVDPKGTAITWTSGDESKVTVEGGMLKPVSPTDAAVDVTAKVGEGTGANQSVTFNVTVAARDQEDPNPAVDSIELVNGDVVTVKVDATADLAQKVKTNDGAKVTWTLSEEAKGAVELVGNAGVIKAVSPTDAAVDVNAIVNLGKAEQKSVAVKVQVVKDTAEIVRPQIALKNNDDNTIELKLGADITADLAEKVVVTGDDAVQWVPAGDAVTVEGSVVTAVKATEGVKVTGTVGEGKEGQKVEITVIVKEADKENVPVTGVTLKPTATSVEVNKKVTIEATVAPSDATIKEVSWACSDETVLAFETGKNAQKVVLVGKKAGKAKVTVTTKDQNKTAEVEITVTGAQVNPPTPTDVKVTGVTLDKTTLSVVEGKTATLTATVAPANATVKDVTWKSSDDKIAKVANGTVTAVKAGKATITVTTKEGNKTATCQVTVTKKKVSAKKVTLSASKNVYVVAGKSITIGAAVEPANTTDTLKFTADSKGKKIVTLKADKKNNSVKVTAKKGKTGKATITAKVGKKSAKVTVNVVKKATNATKIALNKKTLKINTGASAALQAKLTPAKATTEVKWSVDKAGKKIVDVKNGIVKGKKVGVATITAKAGKKSAKCVVTVTKAGVKTKLNKTKATIKVKKTFKLSLKGDSKDTIASCTPSKKGIVTVKVAKNKKSATLTGKKKGTTDLTVITKKGAVLTFKATVNK